MVLLDDIAVDLHPAGPVQRATEKNVSSGAEKATVQKNFMMIEEFKYGFVETCGIPTRLYCGFF